MGCGACVCDAALTLVVLACSAMVFASVFASSASLWIASAFVLAAVAFFTASSTSTWKAFSARRIACDASVFAAAHGFSCSLSIFLPSSCALAKSFFT